MHLKIDYRVPLISLVPRIIICLVFALGVAYLALTNEKGIRFFHLVTISVESATLLFWLLSSLFLLATILMCILLIRNIHYTPIVLEENHFTAPKASLKNELITVPYKSITQIHLGSTRYSPKILTINSSFGQVVLMSNGFKSESDFLLVKSKLVESIHG